MNVILVSVYASLECRRNDRKLFARELSVPDACAFDYSLLVKALRVLYGSKCIIDFSVSSL